MPHLTKGCLVVTEVSMSQTVATTPGRPAFFELRGEVLINTPPLGAPNTVVGTPGFGSITSSGDPRVFQFGAKLNF